MLGRNLFLFSIPVLFGILVIMSGILLWYQHSHFEEVYLKEEQMEITNSIELMTHYFQPLLEANDLEAIDRYCETFAYEERSIVILDANGNAIVTSPNADLRGSMLDLPEVRQAAEYGTGSALRQDARTGVWTLFKVAAIETHSKRQYIRISVPTYTVSGVLNETSAIIFSGSFFGGIITAVFSWYLKSRVSGPLTRLHRGAERIAAGELDATIDVPESGVIRELANAISRMGLQLQKEINQVKKQESFRRDFIANISHEIKTPLTGILSAVEFLKDEHCGPEYHTKCLEILTLQATRLNELVRNILNLSELERWEDNEMEFSPVAMGALVKSAILLCDDFARENNCVLKVNRCEEATVSGHKRILEQAIVNLVVNAIKYSGSPIIEVELFVQDEKVHVLVSDHGIGIPESEREQIFERFYRVRREYGSSRNGSGLGLAIVRQIVQLHHGTVELKPTEEPGAAFEMTFPQA